MRTRAGQVNVGVALVLALVLMACGGDDGGDAGGGDGADGDEAASAPEECPETPFTVSIEGGDQLPGIDGDEFEVVSALAPIQPIVLEDVDFEEAAEAAAASDLLSYTIYAADYELTEDDVRLLGPGDPPADGTVLGFSIVPPTEEPLATGDVVESGTPEFESQTTFGNLGVFYATGADDDPPALATDTEGSGEAEILHLDDERICVRWSQEGTFFGGDAEGEWSIDAVIAGDLGPRSDIGLS